MDESVAPRAPLSPEDFADAFRRFLDAVNSTAKVSPFFDRLSAHLGCDVKSAPVLSEEFAAYEHPTLQRALDALLARPGHRHERVGLSGANKRFMNPSFSDLLSGHMLGEGPVDWVNVHLAGGEVLACVQSGLFLIADETDGRRWALFVAGANADRPDTTLRIEVAAPDRDVAEQLLADLRAEMERLDVYRGHVLSLSTGHVFGPRGANTVLTFHDRPSVGRADVVLPDGVLERVERHTVVFTQHADQLRESGRSLRRGILLFGPPGCGKTLTVKYLSALLGGRTVLLLTGNALGALSSVAHLSRRLAPSLVVLEDVDLVAEERTMPFRGAPSSFLFDLLNEMDGLRDDADVIYVLTTNRADLLEPALALRPGRVDLCVELPLPDAAGRARLFELYGRGLQADLDFAPYVEQTDGASPAYIKELLRQAALHAAEAGRGTRLVQSDLDDAVADLAAGGELAKRMLGATRPEDSGPGRPMRLPTGFPGGMESGMISSISFQSD